MTSVRRVLIVLGIAFTAYLAARGLWWTSAALHPLLLVVALALYLVTAWLCLFWEPRDGARRPAVAAYDSETDSGPDRLPDPTRLPAWAAALSLACAALLPTAVAVGVGPDVRDELAGTWYIGGIGALMTIVMVRRRPWVAWSGAAALAVATVAWLGVGPAISLGLVGSIVWVAAAQFLVWSMDRAARDTSRLLRIQRAASAWRAAQAGRRHERRVQVQRALAVAGPVLVRTIETAGDLEPAERERARIAEGTLREEMRGRRLLDDAMRAVLAEARGRGTTVTLLDEGGLADVPEEELSAIRRELASVISSARSDRLYVRTSAHSEVAVTVVGRSGESAGLSEEDAVDLWREIPRASAAQGK